MLPVPSLNPNRLRGVCSALLVVEARPKPSWAQRSGGRAAREAGQVAHRVHGHLRVVRAGLHAQVAAAAGRVERVPREPGQVGERVRPLRGEAEAGVEQRRPDAEGDGEPGRAVPERLAGVGGRCERVRTGRAVAADLAADGQRLGRGRPPLEQGDQGGPVARGHVVRREVQVALHGRGDARLVRPGEGDDVRARSRALGGGRAAQRRRRSADARAHRAGTEQAERPPAAEPGLPLGRARHREAAAASCDSGSLRASTTWASSRRSCFPTVS